MRKHRQYSIRTFQCPTCSQKMTAPKVYGGSANGHLKKLWCPFCGYEGNMQQISFELIRAC